MFNGYLDSNGFLCSTVEDNFRIVELTFEPRRSMILMCGTQPHMNVRENSIDRVEIIKMEGLWNLRMDDPNIITMNRCQYRIDHRNYWDNRYAFVPFGLNQATRDESPLDQY